jgi:hypothetical protein
MKNFYRLQDELNKPEGRWFLGSINFEGEWDFWRYVSAGEVDISSKELFVNIRDMGIPLDFTMADFELLIVNSKVANLVDKEEVQLIPLKVDGFKSEEVYYLMIVKNEFDCVDEEKSSFDKWEPNNSIRPDKAGQYKTFYKLVVKPESVTGKNIFRIKDYNGIIIISEDLKKKFEKGKVIGVKYKQVS